MQSGLKRKSFKLGPAPNEVAVQIGSGSKGGKKRSVTGLATDALNKTLVAGTLDGTVNVSYNCTHVFILTTNALVLQFPYQNSRGDPCPPILRSFSHITER